MTDYDTAPFVDGDAPTAQAAPVDPEPVVTATPVVLAVVIAVAVVVLAVVVSCAVLNALEAPPLPGELVAVAPTGVGVLGALLAGTLTRRA